MSLASGRVGVVGEGLIAKHLDGLGWQVAGRNVKLPPLGEIDIVAFDEEGILVFVEVKTLRASSAGLKPEDNASPAKLRKMVRAAEAFVQKFPNSVPKRGWRIDLATVQFKENVDLTHPDNCCTINLYRNVIA